MSTRTETPQEKPQGLSATTLAIASLSSIAAALFIHEFWTGGAILGAGFTPIIVAIVSESLKKPTRKIAARRQPREPGLSAMRGDPDLMPVEPEAPRDDRFGIWEEAPADEDRFHRVRGRRLKLAIATGIAAFVLGAVLLTGAELVFGGGGGGGGDRLTIVPGNQQRSDDERDTPTTTQPGEAAPEEEPSGPETTPQTVPAIPETTPAAPPEAAPPGATTPAPGTPAPTPPAEPAPGP